jgi:hypothetical protein
MSKLLEGKVYSSFFTFEIDSNIGIRTNFINPTWALGFVTLSLSMKGATGRPSIFSLSLWLKYSSEKKISKK